MTEKGQDVPARKLPQIIAAVAATLGSFGCGTAIAWTSPALPRISECGDDCDIPDIGPNGASWVGAFMPIGAVLAGPATGFLMSKIGRKWTMISLAGPFVIGYLFLAFGEQLKNVGFFYIGRFFTGFSGGAFALAAPTYIAECSENSVRGSLVSLMQLMNCFGVAMVYALNIDTAVKWNIISGICAVIPVIMAVSMYFMPESPIFLIAKGKEDQARSSLKFLRGPDYNIEHEISIMKKNLVAEIEQGTISMADLFTRGIYLKPFIISMSLMFLQQFSGVNVVLFYTETIFSKTGSTWTPGLSTFLVGVFQIVGTGIAVLIVDRFGRRILLVFSDSVMAVSIVALGVFFYLDENKREDCIGSTTAEPSEGVTSDCIPGGKYDPEMVENLSWLPIVSLNIYIVAFAVGFGPLPWTMNSELFPAEAKGLAASIAFCFNWFCAFCVTKFSKNIEDGITTAGSYFLFGAICAAGTVFILLFVPETKGKSAEEIQMQYFTSKKHRKKLENHVHAA